MKKFELIDLYDGEYTLSEINALKQFWKTNKSFECFGKPKAKNIIIFLDGCKAEYTTKSGKKIIAQSGSFVYTPLQSEYKVHFYDFERPDSCTIGINFLLHDSQNDSCVLDDEIRVFRLDNADYKAIFNKMSKYSEANIVCKGKLKSILYDLFFKLGEYFRKEYCNSYRIISKGITYLEQDEEQLLTIREIAGLCHVSETYFRKMFKQYSGMTPTQYRLNTKICKAKMHLQEQELSISEISDTIGFDDVSYFIAKFKQFTGMTPLKYRIKMGM